MTVIRWLTALLLFCSSQAHAAYTVYLYQSGNDVIAQGQGSVNTAALTFAIQATTSPLSWSGNGLLYFGGTPGGSFDVFSGVTGPTSYGTRLGAVAATSSTGPFLGVIGLQSRIAVPIGYVSGTHMTSTSTWTGTTLATLLATPGTYTWTWGAGATADSLTLFVGATPPLPTGIPTLSEWSLVAISLVLGLLATRQIRRSKG